jgi:hypothetical protein
MQDVLDSFRQITAFQENPVSAPLALDADIRP